MSTSGPSKVHNSNLRLHIDAANRRCYPGTGTSVSDLSLNGYDGSLFSGSDPFDFKTDFGGYLEIVGGTDGTRIQHTAATALDNVDGADPWTAGSGRCHRQCETLPD